MTEQSQSIKARKDWNCASVQPGQRSFVRSSWAAERIAKALSLQLFSPDPRIHQHYLKWTPQQDLDDSNGRRHDVDVQVWLFTFHQTMRFSLFGSNFSKQRGSISPFGSNFAISCFLPFLQSFGQFSNCSVRGHFLSRKSILLCAPGPLTIFALPFSTPQKTRGCPSWSALCLRRLPF